MNELKVFINSDNTIRINEIPGFVPLYKYIDEPKYVSFEYDRREWGRIYLNDDQFITVIAASNIK